MVTPNAGGGSANFVIRFLADLSGYNPARKVEQENQRIAASNRAALERSVKHTQAVQSAYLQRQAEQVAAQHAALRTAALSQLGAMPANAAQAITGAAQAGKLSGTQITALNELYTKRALHPGNIETIASAAQSGILSKDRVASIIASAQSGSFDAAEISNARAALDARREAQRKAQREAEYQERQGGRQGPLASEGGRFWRDPGSHSTRRVGSITALPAGPSAIAGGLLGRGAGTIADIGVVGGLLPEGLSAGASVAGIGAIAAVAGLTALTKAAINASKSLGTVASIELDAAMFGLRRQTRLLFAEIGDHLLPVLTQFVTGLTAAVKFLRLFIPESEAADHTIGGSFRQHPQGGFQTSRSGRESEEEVTGREKYIYGRTPGRGYMRAVLGTTVPGEGSAVPLPHQAEGFWGKLLASIAASGSVPGAANGAIVRPRKGGVLMNVAEGGETEAIMPLRELGSLLYAQQQQNMDTQSSYLTMIGDNLVSSIEQSAELPPLWQVGGDEPAEVTLAGEQGGSLNLPIAPPLTYISRTAYTALTEKDGLYAVYEED